MLKTSALMVMIAASVALLGACTTTDTRIAGAGAGALAGAMVAGPVGAAAGGVAGAIAGPTVARKTNRQNREY